MNTQRITASLCGLLFVVLISDATAQIVVRSSLSDDREVDAGTSYEGQILLVNETDIPREAKVYQSDYLFFHDGSNQYGQPGSDERSNASWIRFNPPTISIPPNESIRVGYVVDVPDSVDGRPPEGSYWSMLLIENVPNALESALPESSGKPRYGVRQVMRYGIQIATHIRGTGYANLQLLESDLVRESDGISLRVNVQNRGSRLARPDVWVEPYNEAGLSMGRVDGVKNRIYPGTSVQQRFDLGQLEQGSYRALVVLDAGGDEVYGAEYSLEIQ